jgi:threonine dehydrogenase-like Zn-dependent dehydrogenase
VIRWPRRLSHASRYDRIAELVGGRRVPALFGNQMLLGGFDLVYDCIGTGRSLTDAMKFVRPRGVVVAMGTSQISVVDTTPLWFSEICVLGSYGRQIERAGGVDRHTYQLVFEMLQTGRLSTDGLLTHTFALREYRAAFHALARRSAGQVVKAAFRHESD